MKRRLYALLICMGLLTAILAAAQRLHATLGESAASIEADRNALSAIQRAKTIRDSFTVQEIESGSTTVREYISPSGVVFGIAWNGLIRPDLTQLLGSYANEYHEALGRIPHNKGRTHLQRKFPLKNLMNRYISGS